MEEKNQFKLLVEGKTDLHVIAALCQYYKVHENFDIIDCGSMENVMKQLKLRLSNVNRNQIIGVLIDADTDIRGRIESIKALLSSFCYNVPPEFPIDGLVIDAPIESLPRIGVWVMPNNKEVGMIEDFALSLIDGNDSLLYKAEQVIAELEKDSVQRYKSVHRSKAKIHTYLAWNDEPGMPIGLAITKRVLNPDSQGAIKIVDWLGSLFNV